MHISAPPAAGLFGNRGAGRERAGGAARLGADLRVYACISRHRLPREPQGDSWLRAGRGLRDSERSHGFRRDAVTVCFQYLVPQVTVSDDSTFYSELAELHSELCVALRICRLSCGPEYKSRRRGNWSVQLQHKSCVSLVDIVSSADSLRSSRNSVQALLESRYCNPSV
jgi:hypothetical protein